MAKRVCICGCGESMEHRDPSAKYHDRKRCYRWYKTGLPKWKKEELKIMSFPEWAAFAEGIRWKNTPVWMGKSAGYIVRRLAHRHAKAFWGSIYTPETYRLARVINERLKEQDDPKRHDRR